jgi:hypothetical protein
VSTARIAISTDAVGFSSVEVNGRDVTDEVQGYRLESVQGQPSVVTLYASAAGAIEGEGIVQVQSGDVGDAVAQFLSNVDPQELERVAIDRSGMGDGNLTKLMLETLSDWARGKP